MKSRKISKQEQKAEHVLVNYFLSEKNTFISFKKLKKKFGDEFGKHDLHAAVGYLVEQGFLERRGNQYRHVDTPRVYDTSVSPGAILEGALDITRKGDAYLVSDQTEKDVWISRTNLGNALPGDVVRVRLLRSNRHGGEGKVIEVVRRFRDTFVGVLFAHGNEFFFRASDPYIAVDFLIDPQHLKQAKPGDKVLVKLFEWLPAQPFPTAIVVDRLGREGLHDTEMKAILLEKGFPYAFSKKALTEAEAIRDRIDEKDIAYRRDFRGVCTFTIDPEDARDYDDALSVRSLPDGRLEVGVHIADVSHYVRPETALDREAALRGTSVYLVDRAIPMLPERLSSHICSLIPDEDRLCFSVVFEMDSSAQVRSTWYGKTIIRSQRRLTYAQAQALLEGKSDPLAEPLRTLNAIAKILRGKRISNGSIAFDSADIQFRLDADGRPLTVWLKKQTDAHQLIEEFMLLANQSVATWVGKRSGKPVPFIYRVHDLPDKNKLNELADIARLLGYTLDVSTPRKTAKSLNRLLHQVKEKTEEYLLTTLAIRTMAKAVYSTNNIRHFGLGFSYYTHFTSPIRRYPDLMVHRILARMLAHEKPKYEQLEALCLHASERERAAAEAERMSVRLKQAELLLDRIGDVFTAVVSGVTEFGIFVLTDDMYCEGLITLDRLRGERFVAEIHRHQIRNTQLGTVIRMGDRIRVRLVNVDLPKRQLDFALVAYGLE